MFSPTYLGKVVICNNLGDVAIDFPDDASVPVGSSSIFLRFSSGNVTLRDAGVGFNVGSGLFALAIRSTNNWVFVCGSMNAPATAHIASTSSTALSNMSNNALITCNNASDMTVTLPSDNNTDLPASIQTNSIVCFLRGGYGNVQLISDGTSTVNPVRLSNITPGNQTGNYINPGMFAVAIKVSNNTWNILGSLSSSASSPPHTP